MMKAHSTAASAGADHFESCYAVAEPVHLVDFLHAPVQGLGASSQLEFGIVPAQCHVELTVKQLAAAAAAAIVNYSRLAVEHTAKVAATAVSRDPHFLGSATRWPAWLGTAEYDHFQVNSDLVFAASTEMSHAEDSESVILALQIPPLSTLTH